MIEIECTREIRRSIRHTVEGPDKIDYLVREGYVHGYSIEYRDERFVVVFTFESQAQYLAFMLRFA